MQIVEINLKDFKDTVVLMLEHPLSSQQPGPKSIDVDYIIDMMRQDWGFYYTFTTNLKRVPEHLSEFPSIREEQRGVHSRPHRQAARSHRDGTEDAWAGRCARRSERGAAGTRRSRRSQNNTELRWGGLQIMPTGRAPAPLTHEAFRQTQRSVELEGLSYKELRVADTSATVNLSFSCMDFPPGCFSTTR